MYMLATPCLQHARVPQFDSMGVTNSYSFEHTLPTCITRRSSSFLCPNEESAVQWQVKQFLTVFHWSHQTKRKHSTVNIIIIDFICELMSVPIYFLPDPVPSVPAYYIHNHWFKWRNYTDLLTFMEPVQFHIIQNHYDITFNTSLCKHPT